MSRLVAKASARVSFVEIRSSRVDALIHLALDEDIGTGDRTTLATLPADAWSRAEVVAKAPLVLAGVPHFARVFALLDPSVEVEAMAAEGAEVARGSRVIEVRGPTRAILSGERTALNILQRMCGIASATHRHAAAVAHTEARIVDTRKTAPGMREMDKYAVRLGGGYNHRFGLDSGILIKDNHIAATGSMTRAIESARAASPHLLKIEVEVTNIAELDEALRAGADIVLLDNMTTGEMAAACARVRAHDRPVLVEASGGLTLPRLREVAETGVDLISVGALTHSVAAADLSLRVLN